MSRTCKEKDDGERQKHSGSAESRHDCDLGCPRNLRTLLMEEVGISCDGGVALCGGGVIVFLPSSL